MIQRREEARLALEACNALRIADECLGKNLDRDVTIEPRVMRAVYLAHPTRTER
jgi:hypothetical protein